MSNQLRNAIKLHKLGGKGKLTDTLIKKLTTYWLAIRRNSDSVEKMKNAVMATYFHYCSTDAEPRHEFCPPGADSWCVWRVAQAEKKIRNFKHPYASFHSDVQKHLLPIYETLSEETLMERCLGNFSQNANQSFHGLIWRLAPKYVHAGFKIVQIATFIATVTFNDGFNGVLKIMEVLELKIGPTCKAAVEQRDNDRLRRQACASSAQSKEARTLARMEKMKENQLYEESEGMLYEPGIAE